MSGFGPLPFALRTGVAVLFVGVCSGGGGLHWAAYCSLLWTVR